MFKKLSSAFIALFLFLSQSSVLAFIDTDDKKVEALYDQGIIENSARFYPTRYISRGDYVMWLLKNREIFLQQDEKTLEPFSDIDKQNYAPYVAKAWRMGILETAREFYPNRSLTRLEALEILFRSEGIATPLFVEIDGFRDLPRSSKDRGVIAKALEMNLLDSISENEFGVNSKLTKLEAAQLLYNMQKITRADELIFSDKKDTTVIVNTGKKKQKEEVFDQVWDMVHNRYIKADDLDDEELMYAAIKGMVESLGDEHSVFLPKIESQSFLAPLDNSTEGIGAFVDFNAQEEVI
ncbi:MAG: S-layer homology domain-containing protein, partial [Candidatus Gracilibacteria bacterium]|nr:S-layer homology domain-containing protein [Candidatus Gracilibacteria bacterium]